MKICFTLLVVLFFGFQTSNAQKSIQEKLGYSKETKLLILHADDAGVSHAVNAATISAFESKSITSASIMVPCPWFPEIAAYAKNHPELDWGIHLTLNAEWKNYKWSGVLPSSQISSLLDKDGYLYSSVEELLQNAKYEEIEAELRAQIERAMAFGIKISHLDSHMGSLYAKPELTELFHQLGAEYGIPTFQAMNLPYLTINKNNVSLDMVFMAQQMSENEGTTFYDSIITNLLKPGLNELIFHLAYDTDEMRAVTIDHPDFGSKWRQNDYDYFTSDHFKNLIKKNKIKLVTWREIKKVTMD